MSLVAGHLREKNGIWQMVLETKDMNGNRKSISRSTKLSIKGNKKRAEAMLTEFRIEYSKNHEGNFSQHMQFSDFMLKWLPLMRTNIQTATYAAYQSNIKNRIVPYFQENPVTLIDLKPHHIQDFYTYAKHKYDIKNKTIIRYHANIRKALEFALNSELILTNPADRIQRPKSEAFHSNTYNEEEIQQLFKAVKGDPIELAVTLAACYGLRREEILGLKWSAIDFRKNTITIRHTIVACSLDGKRILIQQDSTKTKSSYRMLPLMENIKEMLMNKHNTQLQLRKCAPNSYNTDNLDYICVTPNGNLLKPDFISRHFQLVLKKNDLPKIRFHDLRHSCASILHSSGIPMKNIQEWLGHSQIATTMDLYTHLDYQSKEDAAQLLNNLKGNNK